MSDYNPNSVDAVLARIENKLDTVQENNTELAQKLSIHIDHTNNRIQYLERFRWYLAGAAGALILAADWVKDLFKK